MFARRTHWNTRPNALTTLLEEKQRCGETVIDLTRSNPTRCGFSYLPPDALAPLSQAAARQYEPHPRGLLTARKAVAALYADSRILSPADVVLTASTSDAYAMLFRLLCDFGDGIAVPRPSYPLLEYLCDLADVEPMPYRLSLDDEWSLDVASVLRCIDAGARAVILVHPNNPTGTWVRPEDLAQISRHAAREGCAIIRDEVFAPYTWSDRSDPTHGYDRETPALTFSLNGLSKWVGLPQLKLSWITLAGPASLRREALERLDVIADTFLSVNTPVQVALPDLLRLGPTAHAAIRERILRNLGAVRTACRNTAATLLPADAGWYAMLRLPRTKTDDEWAMHVLQHANVLVYPGHFFDADDDALMVISLLPPKREITDGISALLQQL